MKRTLILFICLVYFISFFGTSKDGVYEYIDKGNEMIKDVKDIVNATLNIQDGITVENIPSETIDENKDMNENAVDEDILLSLNDNNYIVDIDSSKSEISFVKIEEGSNIKLDRYVSVDYEKVEPIVDSIKEANHSEFSFFDYLSIYNKVKPHIDTNIPFSEALSLANSFKHRAPEILEEFKMAN